jgi:cell division protein FtsB
MKKIFQDKRIIVIAVIIVLVILFLDFNQRMILLSKLRGQERQLTKEYSQLVATANALKTEIANADSDQVVEKWAREEAVMIQEGDIPIVLLPPSKTIVPMPTTESVIVDKVETWEIWQELFFGD